MRAKTLRRTLVPLVAIVVALVGGFANANAPAAKRQTAETRPNIIFVLTDDLAWNLVEYMPHVRQMQQQGATFTNYFVTDSLCCPSRASIFTGRYPHNTGIFTNGGSDGGFALFHALGEEQDTFATRLQTRGYLTAMMGKYLNGYTPAGLVDGKPAYIPPGWNEWDVAGNGYPEFNYTMNENGALVHHGNLPRAYLTDVVARKGAAHPCLQRGGRLRQAGVAQRSCAAERDADREHRRGGPQARASRRIGRRLDRPAAGDARRRRGRRQHIHLLQLRQRLPHGRSPPDARQADGLRNRHPRAADRDRPWSGAWAGDHPYRSEHRPLPHVRPARSRRGPAERRRPNPRAVARRADRPLLARRSAGRAPRPRRRPRRSRRASAGKR